MFSIAIASAKGGVGKTTTTANLAYACTDLGLDVLAVDLDPQATLTRQLLPTDALTGEPCTLQGHPTVRDALFADVPLTDTLVLVEPHLFLAPATLALAEADVAFAQALGPELRLQRALAGATADLVLIDTPPALGGLTRNALVAADAYLVPVDSAPYALEGLALLENLARQVREYYRPGPAFLGPLLTMYDRTRVAEGVQAILQQEYPTTRLTTTIRRETLVREMAAYRGRLTKGKVWDDYRALAGEILARTGLEARRG